MLRIKELRNEQGLSLRELSEQISISYSSLGKYERGEQQPSIDTIIILANFFHVSIDYLMGNSNYRTANDEYKFKSSFDELENAVAIDIYNTFIETMENFSKFYIDNSISQEGNTLRDLMIMHIADIISGYWEISEKLMENNTLIDVLLNLNTSTLQSNPIKKISKELARIYKTSQEPPTTK